MTWPKTQSDTIQFSSPLCLDAEKNPIVRTCCNGVWTVPTSKNLCNYYIFKFNYKCPPGFQELSVGKNQTLCINLSGLIAWENHDCIKSGTETSVLDLPEHIWMKLYQYLSRRNIKQVWLPVVRDEIYEPLLWKLPGYRWNRPIDLGDYPNVQVRTDIFKGNCLKLILDPVNKTNLILEVDNCKKKIASLCIYNHSLLLPKTCDGQSGFEARFASNGTCYYIEKFIVKQNTIPATDNAEIFLADSILRLEMYEEMIKNSNLSEPVLCLVKINEINSSFTVLDGRGKLMVSSYYNCIVREHKRVMFQPSLSLKFDETRGKLSLSVYSLENIWRSVENSTGIICYTNADNELIKILKVKHNIWSGTFEFGLEPNRRNISKAIYDVKMAGDGPGYYWCEAHTLSDMNLVQTSKVIAWRKKKGSTYSALVNIGTGSLEVLSLFDRKTLKKLTKLFRDHLRVSSMQQDHEAQVMAHRISSVRIMKITDYNSTLGRVQVVFHLIINQNETVVRALNQSFLSTSGGNLADSYTNELGVDDAIAEYYKIKSILYRTLKASSTNKFMFLSLNSTEYCLPTSLSVEGRFNWLSARVGTKSLPKELCLLRSGMPLAVKCEGDFIYGGVWEYIDTVNIVCAEELPEITKTLAYMNESSLTPEVAKETIGAMSEMTTDGTEIIGADIFFLCKTVKIISEYQERTGDNFVSTDSFDSLDTRVVNVQNSSLDLSSIDHTYYGNLALILNNIMAINESIVRRCQRSLNSTNILLDSFDNILSQITAKNASLLTDDGTFLLVTPRLLVFIADPDIDNISGISLHRPKKTHIDFENFFQFKIEKLRSNQSLTELLGDDTVELATYLPTDLIQRIDEADTLSGLNTSESKLTVVITVYYNDHLFPGEVSKSVSKVVSVTLPGHGTNLPVLLPTIFRSNIDGTASTVAGNCGYWDFSSDDYGRWSTDGCEYLGGSTTDPSLIACGCTHLTHFAYLIMGTHYHQLGSDEHRVTQNITHTIALDIITFIGCLLSLFGVLGIVITAIVFKSWREKPGTKVLLHLSAAIALEMILIAFVNTETTAESLLTDNKTFNCIMLGATLHYSVLVAFSWMLITALLQFMRYVKVLGDTRPTRFLLKSSIAGWGAPLIPVLIISIISPESYIPPIEMVAPGICYPKGNALYFGLLLPVALIVIANLVIFIIVIYNIFKLPEVNIRANERDLLVSQLRLSINLFFLLGLSWIFGLATVTKGGIIFSYLFCLTATLQGFVLFVYFIIMDPVTRKFWQLVLSNFGITSCTQKSKEIE